MNAKEIVKAKYPKAEAWWDGDRCVIRAPTFTRKMVELNPLSGEEGFTSEQEAWKDAAKRMKGNV